MNNYATVAARLVINSITGRLTKRIVLITYLCANAFICKRFWSSNIYVTKLPITGRIVICVVIDGVIAKL